jgi:urease accessory protein
MSTVTDDQLDMNGLLRLLTWLSPSFPVGAYCYSHGIEYAVECRFVHDRQGLKGWVETILLHGAGQTDAVFFAHAHRAVGNADDQLLQRVFELADVMRGSSEMALETRAQGTAFLKMLRTVWPDQTLDRWHFELETLQRKPSYPVVVALAAGLHEVPLQAALSAYLHATAANLISAGVRLVPLGQTDGQLITAALENTIFQAVELALETELADIGAAAPMVDWTSISHETQYTRLFRS